MTYFPLAIEESVPLAIEESVNIPDNLLKLK